MSPARVRSSDESASQCAAAVEPRSLKLDVEILAELALKHLPELREGHLDEHIAACEVKKATLRLLPGLDLSAVAHHNANSFLVNNNWLSVRAAVSANLTEMFTAPAAIDTARAGRDPAVPRC